MTRMKKKYVEEVAPALMEKFQYKSVMQIPKIEKIVVSVGCGDCKDNAKALEAVIKDISAITGQHAVSTVARKSVANFKLREGMKVGVKVTLRQDRMWEFLDRLFNVALPRVRDRPRQLLSRPPRADHLPGDRVRQDREAARYEHRDHHDREDRRRGSRAFAAHGRSVHELKEEKTMAKKAMILKQQAPAKFSTRKYNRCKICGRPHAYLRNYGICRICFRELAYKGEIPGVRKASF